MTPEARARTRIDAMLVEAGWIVQGRDELNLHAGPGVVGDRGFAIAGLPNGSGASRKTDTQPSPLLADGLRDDVQEVGGNT